MTQQIINIGAAEDDGTGDHNRVAWDKTNQNFAELYAVDVLLAPLASPALTGNPTAPTPLTADNDTSIATTAFVKAQGYLLSTDLSGYAPLASPALTGNPTAPTPAPGDNDTSVATTAFTQAAITALNLATTYASLASPTLTGDPKAPTPATADNDTSIATTAYVQANLGSYLTTTAAAAAYQPLDGDLTAIAGLTSAADQAPYFTGSGTAALMTITAAARTVLDDTTVGAMLTTMGGLSSATAATTYAPLASPTFTGDPKAPTPATADNDTSIATTAYVQAQGYLTSAAATAAYQPLDGDLTAIAALTGTNTIYYRNAANSWAAVTIGTNLTFTGGTLAATGGIGDVTKAGTNIFTGHNYFTNNPVVIGNSSDVSGYDLEIHAAGRATGIEAAAWVNTTAGPYIFLDKSRGTTIGSYTAVASGDVLGEIQFRGSTGTSIAAGAVIRGLVNGTPGAGFVPGAIQLYAANAAGTLINCGSISPAACNFIGSTSAAPAGYVGEYLTASASSVALGAGGYTATATLAIPAGDWDIRGVVRVNGTAGSYMYMNVYTLSGSTSGSPDDTQTGILTGLADVWTSVGPFRKLLTAASTTFYLNIYMAAAGTLVFGEIQARRRH